MSRQIVVDIVGDASKFVKATKEATGSAEKFGGLAGKGFGIGAGIGAFNLLGDAADRAVDFLGDAVRAAMEEEASIAKLDTALRENVDGWNGNRDAIENVLKARMDLGFSDDEQRDSLAKLVGATGDVTRALDIQRTAMDLARYKGIDLATASQALIKVEAGQYRALKDLGIELKAGATQTEALAAVQKVAQDQAEAYAQTTAGKLLTAQTKIGDKMDELGTKILPAVVVGIDAVSGAIDVLNGKMDGPSGTTNLTINGATAWATYTRFVAENGDAVFTTAGAMDTFAEATAAAREPTKGLTGNVNGLTGAMDNLTQSGSEALAAVKKIIAYRADLMDMTDEAAYLAGRTPRKKKKKHKPGTITNTYDGAAAGGSHSGLTWVGEQGPELVNLPGGSFVHTAAQSRRMAAGGATINVNVAGNILGLSGVDELMDIMAQRLRLDGV